MENAVTISDEKNVNKNLDALSTCVGSSNEIISSSSLNLEKSNSTRKCAYCRNVCETIKLCDGCRKRAYCSEACRTADWSIDGQRHINWCINSYECGEEDVDWEIVPVPNKGMGIIAKRYIPTGYRIMADPSYTNPYDHPGILELAPEGADLETKFYINCIDADDNNPGEGYVGLCFSRANHSCRPNADYAYDEATRIIIIFALKDIKFGDEICVCYWSFANLDLDRKTANLSPEEEFQSVQNVLTSRYGIICPGDCYCRDSNAKQLVLEGRRLHTEMSLLVGLGRIEEALEYGEKLLSIRRRLNISMIEQFETEYHCYQIALMGGETLTSTSKGYLQNVYDFYKYIYPYSPFVKNFKSLLMKYAEIKSK